MMPFGILSPVYLVSMLIGAGFIAVNLFMGNFGESADDGGAGGDDFGGSGGDSGGGGHDFGGGDSGSADGGGSGHDFGGGDSGSADGGGGDAGSSGDDFGGANGNRILSPGLARANILVHHRALSARATPFIPRLSARIGSFILGLLSPMAIAIFLTFFGGFGLLFERLTPWLGYFTLVPAILISMAISNLFKYAVRWLIVHGNVSTEAKAEDSIGQVGEIITPIKEGRAGEVTYVIGSKRYHSAAKPHKEGIEFKRGSKVIITGIKDHIVFVDECNLLEFQ